MALASSLSVNSLSEKMLKTFKSPSSTFNTKIWRGHRVYLTKQLRWYLAIISSISRFRCSNVYSLNDSLHAGADAG